MICEPECAKEYWVTLLVKLGVVACLASFLVRSSAVKRMLMQESRTLGQRLRLSLWFSAVFAASVATRVVGKSYQAVDLGLEGSLLAGILGGYVTGLVSGILISLPAMFAGEHLTMPLLAGIGLLGGMLRDCAPDPEEIWRFSPFFDLNLYRFFRRTATTAARRFTCSCWRRSSSPNSSARRWGSCSSGRCSFSIPSRTIPHPLADRGRLRDHAVRGEPAAQDLEQRAQREEAGGAAAAADAGAPAGAQPARSTRIFSSIRSIRCLR